jgi:hypothetical protein
MDLVSYFSQVVEIIACFARETREGEGSKGWGRRGGGM